MKIWSGSESSHFLPDVRDWVNLWRDVLGAALQRVDFFDVFFSKKLPEPQRKEVVFEKHPCVKITARHGCLYCPVLALLCVWTWYGSDSAMLCSGSLLWRLRLVFWVGALGMGLVGLKHQLTWTILNVWHSSPVVLFGLYRHVHPQQSLGYMDIGLGQFPFPECLDTALCRAVECRGSGNSAVKSVSSVLFLLSPLTP